MMIPSTDDDSGDENVAEMDDEVLVVAPKDFFYMKGINSEETLVLLYIYFLI